MSRSRRPSWVALDCGSAGLRVAGVGRGVVDHVPGPRHHVAVQRGLVRDPDLLAREIREVLGHQRPAAAAVSLPVHAGHDDIAALHAAVGDALGVQEVWPVPAAVASTTTLPADAGAVVLDIGAQLLEVSRVEGDRVVEREVLDWGVDDLVRDVTAMLHDVEHILIDPHETAAALVGSVAAGRDARSGATRVVRIERRHVEEAAGPALAWLHTQVAVMRRGPIPVVAVGGGMRLPVLRLAALDWVGRVRTPGDPRLATVRGLAAMMADAVA